MIIAKIETEETRIFPTRTKTNFSICLQLLSTEEYLMRNFYSYKDNREKVIQMQLMKISDQIHKHSHTPAKLLVNSNLSTQLNYLVQKTKPLMVRQTEGAPQKKIDRGSVNALSRDI